MSDPTNAMMKRLLTEAGVGRGMNIVELGCGGGVVSEMLAEIVGPTGRVVAVDRDAAALATARERLASNGYHHVSFYHADLTTELPIDGLFDAAVTRRVLMYLPNPSDTLKRLRSLLRPSGLLVVQETDGTLLPGRCDEFSLHDFIRQQVWETVRREGANPSTALNLPRIFEDAGFSCEHVRAEAVLETTNSAGRTGAVAQLLLPRMISQGVASANDIGIETLEKRLADELEATKMAYIAELIVGAWGRLSKIS